MSTVSVVVPTIPGREDLLERTRSALKATSGAHGVQIIVVRNRPTLGQGWNDGAAAADGEFLMLAADDIEPAEGWIDAAIAATWDDVWPSPRILNVDGSLHSCGTMGGGMLMPECSSGTPCGASPFPFMARDVWAEVGPALEVSYYGDDYLSWRARCVGLRVEVVRGYCLTHLEGTVGRSRSVARSAADRATFLAAIAVESPAPVEVAA